MASRGRFEALYASLRDRSTSLAEILGKAEAALPENVVEVMVGEAYSRLEPHAQRVMQALAVYNRPVPAVAVDFLLQPVMPGLDAAPMLNYLVNMRLVHKDRDRYFLHAVDGACARSHIPRTIPTSEAASTTETYVLEAFCERGAEYYRNVRKPQEAWKSLQDLEPQCAEIDLLYQAKRYDEAGQILRLIYFDYLRFWGHYALVIDYHEWLARKIHDLPLRVESIGNLGTVYWDVGRLAEALACLQEAISLAETAEISDNLIAVLRSNRGQLYRYIGRIDNALRDFLRACDADFRSGLRSGIGSDLNNASECYGDAGHLELCPAMRTARRGYRGR